MRCARDVGSKLLAALGEESAQVVLATATYSKVIDQFLDCSTSCKNDGITCRKSSAYLKVHSDAGCVN